jgi:hypothetical protein
MNGDVVALRLCLERAAPLRKSRPVVVDLPPIDTANDVVGAVGAIVVLLVKACLRLRKDRRLRQFSTHIAERLKRKSLKPDLPP